MSAPDTKHVQVAIQHAELFVHQGRFTDALNIIDEALADAYDHPDLLRTRGWVQLSMGQDARAIETFEMQLGLAPDDSATRFLLSHARLNTGDYAGAELEARACLEADPQSAESHLQLARVLTAPKSAGRHVTRHHRKLALQHLETGLGLDPERADSYHTAATINWRLGRLGDAMALTEQGLAIAPEHQALVAQHADLTAASAQPTTRQDAVTQPATHVQQMSKLLAQFPQHVGARRALFQELWTQRMLLIDAPVSLIAILAIAAGAAFGSRASLLSLLVGGGVAAFMGLVRATRYLLITVGATPGFSRLLFREQPFSRLVNTLTLASWLVLVAGAIVLCFVRDPIAIRIIFVVLGLGTLASLVASLIWQLRFVAAAKRVGGFEADADSLWRYADQRSMLGARIWFRLFAIVGLGLITFITIGGRSDALAIVWLACGALVLSPAAGSIATRIAERRARSEIPPGTSLVQGYRAPGLTLGSLTAVTATLALALTLVGAAQLPVLPNEHDSDEPYVLTDPSTRAEAGGESIYDGCGGRPASRLACIAERNKERAERGWGTVEVPTVSTPTLDLDASGQTDVDADTDADRGTNADASDNPPQ